MKVIMIDDEKAMLIILEKLLLTFGDIEIVGSFQSSLEAYEFLLNHPVDIIFVDINMPEESGIDFARRVSERFGNIAICFLTAHKEFALDAFGVYAFDYIIKPVTLPRLESTLQRISMRIDRSKVAADAPKLSVYCLGELILKDSNQEIIHLTSKKSYELLAYLILKKGSFVSKWSVMEHIFQDMPPKNAETYLNTTVYKLRKALEPFGMKSVIIFSDESYRIDMKSIYVDYFDFEESLKQRTGAGIEEELRIDKLYKGELFGEKDYDWCFFEKERLSGLYTEFAKKLVNTLLLKEQISDAIAVAKKLLSYCEYDDEANCMLMRIYAKQKDKYQLEKQFKRYINALKNELGVAPDSHIYKLYNDLMRSIETRG